MNYQPSLRRKTSRQSLADHAKLTLPLSFVLEHRIRSSKGKWPEPEKSIGRPCDWKIKGTHCWEVAGPARDVCNKLAPEIHKLLTDNVERLEQGEANPGFIAFNMWMEGSIPSSAHPILVFASKSRRQRSNAKSLLKESNLLDGYPGISIKTLDRMPAVLSVEARTPQHGSMSLGDNNLDVSMIDRSSELCGAPISLGNSKLAIAMGIVIINDEQRVLISHQQLRRRRQVHSGRRDNRIQRRQQAW